MPNTITVERVPSGTSYFYRVPEEVPVSSGTVTWKPASGLTNVSVVGIGASRGRNFTLRSVRINRSRNSLTAKARGARGAFHHYLLWVQEGDNSVHLCYVNDPGITARVPGPNPPPKVVIGE